MRVFVNYRNIIWMIKSRAVRWSGHVARMGNRRNACKILVRKPERERPLGKSRRRGQNNIKMDLKEIVCVDVDGVHEVLGRV
jgi:hypothetical protein